MIRASGTLADANKLGAVAAFWTVGALVYARGGRDRWSDDDRHGRPWARLTAAWLSGSRTGLAAAHQPDDAALEAMRSLKLDLRKAADGRRRRPCRGRGSRPGAAKRIDAHDRPRGTLGYIPFVGDRGIADSANELLWDRFGYGPAAIQMIKEHPIDGVGLGTFHALSYDYGKLIGRLIPGARQRAGLVAA